MRNMRVLGQFQLTEISVYVDVSGTKPLSNSEITCKTLWSTAW